MTLMPRSPRGGLPKPCMRTLCQPSTLFKRLHCGRCRRRRRRCRLCQAAGCLSTTSWRLQGTER